MRITLGDWKDFAIDAAWSVTFSSTSLCISSPNTTAILCFFVEVFLPLARYYSGSPFPKPKNISFEFNVIHGHCHTPSHPIISLNEKLKLLVLYSLLGSDIYPVHRRGFIVFLLTVSPIVFSIYLFYVCNTFFSVYLTKHIHCTFRFHSIVQSLHHFSFYFCEFRVDLWNLMLFINASWVI